MPKFTLFTSVIFLFLRASKPENAGTKKFTGNPYSSRSDIARKVKTIKFDSEIDGAPFPGAIAVPNVVSGKFPFVYFVGGMYSMVPEVEYNDLIDSIVKKGYVVVYPFNARLDKHMDNWRDMYDWTCEHVQEVVNDPHRNDTIADLHVDVTNPVILCNSAGCEIAKDMANYYSVDQFAGIYFLDPVIGHDDILLYPVETSAKFMIDESSWCQRCCAWKNTNQPLWDSLNSKTLKAKFMLNNAGHCSPLNYSAAMLCYKTHVCAMDADEFSVNKLRKFHDCLSGKITAFITDAIWNDVTMLDYQFRVNEFCVNFVDENFTTCVGSDCSGMKNWVG